MPSDSNPPIGLYNESALPEIGSTFPDLISVPFLSILSDRVIYYKQSPHKSRPRTVSSISKENLTGPKNSGVLSAAASRLIRKKLNAWLYGIKVYNDTKKGLYKRADRYPVFITLTLPSKQIHDDNLIKKCVLGRFIEHLKNASNMKYYFWRAETQKNGNIHFHLIVDCFIPMVDIQMYWNMACDNLGYVERYKERKNVPDPPSTNVKGADQVDDFINYVLKYCIKPSDGRKIQGRIWGMSDELRLIDNFVTEVDSINTDILRQLSYILNPKVYKDDFHTVIIYGCDLYKHLLNTPLHSELTAFHLGIYDTLYSNKKPPPAHGGPGSTRVNATSRTVGARQLSFEDFLPPPNNRYR